MGLLASFALTGFALLHPLHVTYSHIEVNQDQKTISISHKFFSDDLSLLLFHLYEKEVHFSPDKEIPEAEISLIKGYIEQRFILMIDKDTLSPDSLRIEQDEKSMWIYYAAELINPSVKNISIDNLLLLDLYMDQTNLIIITQGNKEEGFSCDYHNRRMVLKLQE